MYEIQMNANSYKNIFTMALSLSLMMTLFTSCDTIEKDNVKKEYDATLFGEWIRYNDGNKYIHDYYCFYSDGTGIHGSYEIEIDWVNEDDDITWYTVDKKYIYIDGRKHKYSCDGTSLSIDNKEYEEKQ